MIAIVLDMLTILILLFGLFFMFVAALGLVRLPDVYHRMHAATKGMTLGIMALMIGLALVLATHTGDNIVTLLTKVVLVILFQFLANPVGAHMLAKAAKLDRAPTWQGTIADEHPHQD